MRAFCTFIVLAAVFALLGCSEADHRPARAPASYSLPALPALPAFEANASSTPPATSQADGSSHFANDIQLTGQLASAPASRSSAGSVTRTLGGLAGGIGAQSAPSTSMRAQSNARMASLPAGEAAKEEEKIEREAQLAIEVKDVSEAAARVLALVASHQGSVTKDQRSSGTQANAELLVRVPSAHFDAFVSELASIGAIRNRNVRAVDTTIEHKDLGILVANLEAALVRYRDLLQKATEPLQVLAVERELERVRSDLDRIKGRLELLKDRVARSTVAIALHSPEAPSDIPPEGRRPTIAPGLRGVSLVDVRESGTSGYLGTGLTLRLPRAFGDNSRGMILDVDVMRACCKARPERSDWAYDILTGVDLYSESLQSGRRRWLNPYLGLRVGLAQSQNRADFASAGVFGLELVKTSALMIDIQARAMALVGNPDGPHAALQPSFGFDLGF